MARRTSGFCLFSDVTDGLGISEGLRLYQMIELPELLREVPESILCGPRIPQTSGHELSQVLCVGLVAPPKPMFKLNWFHQTQN